MNEAGASARGRRALPWLAVALGLLLVAIVAGSGGSSDDGVPFDPDSTSPRGTRAAVLLLDELGSDVRVSSSVPGDEVDAWLILVDVLDLDAHHAAREWVRTGGILVVADPYSDLSALTSEETFITEIEVPRGRCDIAALDGMRSMSGTSTFRYDVAEVDQSCFGDGDEAFVVASREGDGWIVSIASPFPFTNAELGDHDNAAVLAALLGPRPGSRVDVLSPVADETGDAVQDRSLTDAVSTSAWVALLQLLVAFGAYSWYRGRRLGQPVQEPQPVDLAGSELVLAVGNLLMQRDDPSAAAASLRRDLRRHLAERLGLPPTVGPEVIADVASDRTGVPRERVLAAVADHPVPDDEALLALARTIDEIREEILHAR